MLNPLRILLATLVTACVAQPASAFWWCHHCCHKQVVKVTGTAAPGGAVITGGNATGLTPAPGGAFLTFPSFVTPSSSFVVPGSSFVTPGSGAAFGFTVNPAPGTVTNPPPTPAPVGTNCATAADVQRLSADVQALLNARLAKTDGAIAAVQASALTEAQIRKIVQDEVKVQLSGINQDIKKLSDSVAELQKNSITKQEVAALKSELMTQMAKDKADILEAIKKKP